MFFLVPYGIIATDKTVSKIFQNGVFDLGLAILVLVVFLITSVFIFQRMNTQSLDGDTGHLFSIQNMDLWNYRFVTSFLILLAVRLVLAAFTEGYPSDMSCWTAWGQRMAEVGTSGFYAPDYFCDYPPGYLYILGVLTRISEILNLSKHSFDFLYKLPAIVCDMVLFTVLFQEGRRILNGKAALLIGILFMISPIFCLDSAVWGQVESVLLVFLVLSMLKIYQKKYLSGILLYVLAILIKPQGLILAPIYLLAVLESRNLKTILSCVLGGLFLFLVCAMPFSNAWQEYSGPGAFLHALNPLWLLEKYLTTLASYPYYSVNAFNLYGLLHLNWVALDAYTSPQVSSLLNSLILAVGVFGAMLLFFKIKNRASKLFLSAYFLYAFLFTFAFKMHERYIVLPIFFLLLEYIFSKNKKILYLFSGFSAVGFLNLYYTLQLVLTTGSAPDYRLVMPISLMEVVLFLVSLPVIVTDYIKHPKTPLQNEQIDLAQRSWISKLEASPQTAAVMEILCGKSKRKEKKMVRLDYFLLAGIVVVYTAVAFFNLGTVKSPQTFYQPQSAGERFVITLSDVESISEIDYYCGIGDVDEHPGIRFSYSVDGVNWTKFPEISCSLQSVFKWETEETPGVSAKYLRGVAESADYRLFELGIRRYDESLASIVSVSGEGSSNFSAMADEQECVTNQPSYRNGTYFDEIYHPRTAYEHLHGMPYYETTHPPLGKLIMAVGIFLFGMSPFGWRCAGTFIGVLMLPIFYLLLKQLFGRTRYAVIGTLLFAFDFMHFSLTRMGTIDSYPVLFILCMYYFMYRFGVLAVKRAKGTEIPYRKLIGCLALSGISMGLGCASKWTAVYASAGLAIIFAVILFLVYRNWDSAHKKAAVCFMTKICLWCLLFFILIPAAIYTLSYLPISMVDGYGNVFQAMWNNQKYMLSYHSKLGGTHPYASEWYTWPFVYKPMWAYQAPNSSVGDGQIGCISIFQNPFLSWLGIAAFFYSLWVGWKRRDMRVLFLTIALLAQYLPWIFVRRYALQYHFFATLPFLILFVIYAMENLERRFRRFGYVSSAVTVICLMMFLAFYPVLSGIPVSQFYVETFLTWFPSWIFFI